MPKSVKLNIKFIEKPQTQTMTQQPTDLDKKAVFEQLREMTKELRQKLVVCQIHFDG